MLFHPQCVKEKEGAFSFSDVQNVVCHPCLSGEVFREFWHNFCFSASSLQCQVTNDYRFSLGNITPPSAEGYAYAIKITPLGICITANDEAGLRLGFMTLLDRIYARDGDNGMTLALDCCEIYESPLVEYRMVHFCIFPETELWELQRFLRLSAALRYSHVIVEFWGMLQFDCMQELAWKHRFRKEEVSPILKEARELGLEIIPMFNHWGHASGSRVLHGKHVVLDQNPALQTYFSEDGWCWDITKPKVKALLTRIRDELCALCGEGDFFHIGCDEAYNFDFTEAHMGDICDYINEVCLQMKESGRRVIVWGDMFLAQHPAYKGKNYICGAPRPDAEAYMLSHITRDVVIADWQYYATEAPVETALLFQKEGFDTLLCPWDLSASRVKSCVATVKQHQLMGLMHTTWHTLSKGMPFVILSALGCFENIDTTDELNTKTAALLRKVCPVGGDYHMAGWGKCEVGTRLD